VGILDVLERVGLVRKDGDSAPADDGVDVEAGPAGLGVVAPPVPVEESSGMTINQVYEAAGVPASAYPAERLLRLLGGLKEMDEATRRLAIHAMDEADDSWTIDDPVKDAAAKVAALDAHAATIRAGVAQAERETQVNLGAAKERQKKAETDIRRQLEELNALLAREIARGTQEGVALEAGLQGKKERATRELDRLARTTGDLRGLMAQFTSNATK